MRERKDWLTEGNTAQRILSLWGHMVVGYLVFLVSLIIVYSVVTTVLIGR